MRTVLFWIASIALVLGALSATVSMATVKWLYPTSASAIDPPPPEEATATARVNTQEAPSSAELGALEFIRRASAGDTAGAKALAAELPVGLYEQIANLRPVVQKAAALPGPAGAPTPVLVWSTYRREDHTARGAYQVSIQNGKVTGVSGPFAPDGGYQTLPWAPTDEKGRKVNLNSYKGRGLVIVAPRAPEADLVPSLARLQAESAPKGVDVILAVDLGGPDLTSYARNSGYTGPIWRIKGHIEEVAMVSKGRLMGAAGLLVDRTGLAVASLTALDPARYGLDGQPIQAIAPAVFRAYGLIN